jgi:hypothetical protein
MAVALGGLDAVPGDVGQVDDVDAGGAQVADVAVPEVPRGALDSGRALE